MTKARAALLLHWRSVVAAAVLSLLATGASVRAQSAEDAATPISPVAGAPEASGASEPAPVSPLEAAHRAVPGLFRVSGGAIRDVEVEVLDRLIDETRRATLDAPRADAMWIALDFLAARAGPIARYQAQVKLDETVAAAIERADEAGLVELTERLAGWLQAGDHPLDDSVRDVLQVKVRCAALAIDSADLLARAEAVLGPPDRRGARRQIEGGFDLAPVADLFAVDARGSLVAVAGRSGTLRVSRDGGEAWANAAPQTAATLLDLSVGGDDSIWATGSGGAVVRSLDAGASWDPVSLPFGRTLLGVAVQPDGVLLAGDYGLVLRSVDRGASWTCVPQYAAGVLRRLVGAGDGACAYGEFGTIGRLDEEGFATTPGALLGGVGEPYIFDVWFSEDLSVGIAVGLRGLMLRSTDQGQSWRPDPLPYDRDLYAVHGAGDAVTVVGDAGFVARSRDGGRSFERVDALPAPIPLTDVVHSDAGPVFVVGMRGTILRSADARAPFEIVGRVAP